MTLARVISFITNPIFILMALPFFLVYKTTKDFTSAWEWTIYTCIFLFIFGLFVLIGVRKKIFTDLDVSKREQRPLLYSVGLLIAIIYLSTLYLLHAPMILLVTTIGIIGGTLISSIVNIKIKTSIHVAALSALITALGFVYKGYYLLLVFLIPVIGWSRIKIKRHTLPEVITGGILGSVLSVIIYTAIKTYI